MRSARRGESTSRDAEVTNISRDGFRLLAGGEELFVAFDVFPWFRTAAVSQILNVQSPHAGQFRWPDLDVDLPRASILNPEKFPLVSRRGGAA